jgi:hypothetical protein
MTEANDKRPSWRKRALLGGLLTFAGLVIAFVVDDCHPEGSMPDTPMVPASIDPERNDPTKDAPAPKELRAILNGLDVGAQVSGWTITALTVSTKNDMRGALTVALSQGKKSFAIWILPKTTKMMASPQQTNGYTFHTGMLAETSKQETSAPLAEVVKRVRAFEGSPEAPATESSACAPGSGSASAAGAPSAAPSAMPAGSSLPR